MILLSSVECFKMLQALFPVCVEEAGCLLFWYDAVAGGCGVVGLQPAMCTLCDAAKAPFSFQ